MMTKHSLAVTIEDFNKPNSISFTPDQKRGPALTITPDGRLERGPGFATDDEASAAFFDVLSLYLPCWIAGLRRRAETAEREVERLRAKLEEPA